LDLPGVSDGVSAARTAVDALLSNRTVRRRSAEVSLESSLHGAWASARLAGAEFDLGEVRSGSAASDPIVQGALRAQAAIGSLTDTWTRAPRQALARLHVLAAADLVTDTDALGRPAAGGTAGGMAGGIAGGTAGGMAGAAARLDTLAAVLSSTAAPAVVVAAIVHGELLSLDAFAPVSGIVARVAVRLTLIERGLDPKSLVVVEAGHRDLADEYAAALTAYRSGSPDGLARWIRHCADAVVAGALEATAICEAIARG
jgi:hypothetical protein